MKTEYSNITPFWSIALAVLAAFSCQIPVAHATQQSSSLEIQRSIQRNWSAVEASKSTLDAEMTKAEESLAAVEGEIAAVKGTLANATLNSAEQLEAKTRLVELLTSKHVAIYKRDKEIKKIVTNILGEVLELEEGLAAMSNVYAVQYAPEVQSFKRKILGYVQNAINESSQETVNLGRELGLNAEPATQMWLRNSSRTWNLTAAIVKGQLARGPGSIQSSYRTNLINAASFRSSYETLIAKLSADGEHSKQVLMNLKVAAELQVASLIGRQMQEGIGEMFDQIEVEYNTTTGINKRYEDDMEDLQLVQPNNPITF